MKPAVGPVTADDRLSRDASSREEAGARLSLQREATEWWIQQKGSKFSHMMIFVVVLSASVTLD